MELGELRHFRDAVRRLQRYLGGQWKNDAACCGITVAQCHTLMEVGKKGELSLVELASILDLDTSTLSRTVDGMVQNGLVERHSNPDDRRYLKIVMTKQGQKVYEEINNTFDDYYQNVFQNIPEEKHRQVMESLELLSTAVFSLSKNYCCREEITK